MASSTGWPYHPWTNGHAERMNRTIKDATVKVYHYENLESLKAHVLAFITAYNFAKHLKALRWRTPYQVICEAWAKDPSILRSIRIISFRDHTLSLPPLSWRSCLWDETVSLVRMVPRHASVQRYGRPLGSPYRSASYPRVSGCISSCWIARAAIRSSGRRSNRTACLTLSGCPVAAHGVRSCQISTMTTAFETARTKVRMLACMSSGRPGKR